METLCFSPTLNLIEDGKWFLAVTSFEATNSVFNITDENNSFSIGTLGYSRLPNFLPDGIIDTLKEFLKFRSQNDIELHVKQVEKRRTRIKIENTGYNLASFDYFKSEILAKLKRVKCHDLEYVVYRLELTYDEKMDVLDIQYTSWISIGYTPPPGIYEISYINLLLKPLLPNQVIPNITIDDIGLKSNLTKNKTRGYTNKTVFLIPY